MITQLVHPAGMTWTPKKDPNPISSLTNATVSRTKAYPQPEATPSRKEGQGLLLRANASHRPIIIQLVIIRPTYGPRASLIVGTYALSKISTMIT